MLITRNTLLFRVISVLLLILASQWSIWCLMLSPLGLIYVKYEDLIAKWFFTGIYDEFIKEIGLSPDFKKYLENLRKLAMLEIECALNPTPINFTRAESKRIELDSEIKTEEVKYSELIAKVSKMQGYHIDANKMTVLEFYSIINAK